MKSSAGKIQMTPFDALFQVNSAEDSSTERVQEIALSDLYPFKNHPFKVLDDEAMQDTVESIKAHGILVPAIARPRQEGGYELIAGHRRKHGAELAEITTMPVLIRDLDDDEATIIMVDSNIQRENLLPSEKAWAYKMKLDAIRRKAGRIANNSRQVVGNLESADIVGKDAGESGRQVQRYIRLTELLLELLQMVDDKKLPFNSAVELSYLCQNEQEMLLGFIEKRGIPSLEQSQKLKKYSKEQILSDITMAEILSDGMPKPKPLIIRNEKITKYFPPTFTKDEIENLILTLLEKWKNEQI